MTFLYRLTIITAVAAAIALASTSGRRPRRLSTADVQVTSGVAVWLAVVAGALIVVGFVSHTVLRHIVQIAPIVGGIGLLFTRSTLGACAAAALFAFWFLLMAAIWLFLLGIARIFSGTYTTAEVALTIVIGAASLLGLHAAYRQGATTDLLGRVVTIVGFCVLQMAAMVLSFQPFISAR